MQYYNTLTINELQPLKYNIRKGQIIKHLPFSI